MPWEYEDQCSCITDSEREDADSDDDGCTPCECYGVTYDATARTLTRNYPRSVNWDFKPTEYKLHYKRADTGHAVIADDWLEILKTIWIEEGIYNCA